MKTYKKSSIMSIPIGFVESVPEHIVNEVFSGEYESGLSGCGLQILDIGANVGAFSLWAVHRWPGSFVQAFEPHPDTFKVLKENIKNYPMISCFHAAVTPYQSGTLVHRGVNDGESALIDDARLTFNEETLNGLQSVHVPVMHPVSLPRADIVKLDVEGSEAAIILGREWSEVSLILIEFQTIRNLQLVKEHLKSEFTLIKEKWQPWNYLLDCQNVYRKDLLGDFYGTAFFLRRNQAGKLKSILAKS
jgi:FkbM family methyltransferase